jgi:hypothetical protein
MALRQIAEPAVEPITLTEAKNHLRASEPDDDALITGLISAARMAAENICRRAFVTQQWELVIDSFPRRMFFGSIVTVASYEQIIPNLQMMETGYTVRFRAGKIELPLARLQSVDYVRYLDANGVLQTLDPTQYIVDAVSEPGVIAPAYATYWPESQSVPNAVRIGFTAGYGDASKVPAGIKSWMLMRIGALYENREEVAVGQRVVVLEIPFVDRLLDPYRIASL